MRRRSAFEGVPLAIVIEFVNVIVRKSSVEDKYPGGLDQFVRQELCNYVEDEHLVRVGFMSGRDAFGFVKEMEVAGLRYSDDPLSDIAVITRSDPAVPSWLTVGECEGYSACWLGGNPPGKLVELDPGMLLRCRAFATVGEIVRVLGRAHAEVRERTGAAECSDSIVLECERGAARIEVEVLKDANSGRPVGVWGRRDLKRRTCFAGDIELMKDLTSALRNAGAE